MRRKTVGWASIALVAAALLAIPATRVVRSLMMTRGGVATFTKLLASANAQDLDAVRSLCTGRYLESHRVEPSPEGGVVGFPRVIHKNFQAWVAGDDVWLCPTDRVGPVYRFVLEDGSWKFDGLVGLLKAGGQVERLGEDLFRATEFPAEREGPGRSRDRARRGNTGATRPS